MKKKIKRQFATSNEMIKMHIRSTHRRDTYNCQGETSGQHRQKDAALWKLDKLYSTRAVFLFSGLLYAGLLSNLQEKFLQWLSIVERLNHTNLLDFPHCFSAWETVLFETIAFCSNISTRLLATELAKGKVGKQKRGFRSKQEILSLHFVSSIKQNGQQHSSVIMLSSP